MVSSDLKVQVHSN